MGVMCSLFGHDYADPDVERERDEEGTEVVVTAKRVERCRNCGHERTIAENTEVTALSAAAGVVRESDGTVVATPRDAATDGSATIDDERNGPKPLGTNGEAEDSGTAALDESSSPGGSLADSVTPASALDPVQADTDGSPSTNGADDSDDATVDRIRDDPVPDPVSDDRPRRAPGEWPDEPGRTPNPVHDGGTDEPTFGESRSEAGIDTVGGEASRTPGGSFVCSSCEFDAAAADSPLRAGDICPHCGVGYLGMETRKG